MIQGQNVFSIDITPTLPFLLAMMKVLPQSWNPPSKMRRNVYPTSGQMLTPLPVNVRYVRLLKIKGNCRNQRATVKNEHDFKLAITNCVASVILN